MYVCMYVCPLFSLLFQHYLDSPSEAIDHVKHGKAWAAIIIPENFSIDLRQRALDIAGKVPVPDDIINSSTVEIYEDVTSKYTVVQRILHNFNLVGVVSILIFFSIL